MGTVRVLHTLRSVIVVMAGTGAADTGDLWPEKRGSAGKATLYRFVGGLVELPFTGRSDMALRRLVQGVNVVLLLSLGATNMRKRKKPLPTLPADFTDVQALPIPLFAACSEQHEETDGIGRAARLRRVIVHAKAKPA